MNDRNPPNPEEDLGAPPRLQAALQALNKEQIFVPPQVDEAVLRAAREQLAKAHKRPVWRTLAPWAAAAAALTLGVWLVRNQSPSASRNAFAPQDINHDGKVDILDAFALARQLEQGEKPNRQEDQNGDGVVDRRDVDAIAAQAVKLGKGGRS